MAKVRKKQEKIYMIWAAMKQRCVNPNNKAFHNYGGRGISVCDRWSSSFLNFKSDMGAKPSESHTLERINNNGNYESSNCTWATRGEQIANRRIRRDEIVYKGETATQASIRITNGSYKRLIHKRITEMGWPTEKAFTTPHHKAMEYMGERNSAASIRLGGQKDLVRNRLRRGWSKKAAFTIPAKGNHAKFIRNS